MEKSECVISIWAQLSAAVLLLLFKWEGLFGSLFVLGFFFKTVISVKKAASDAFCLICLEFDFVLKAA